MIINRLFQGSFEESLNLENDAFYKIANKTYNQAIGTNPDGWSIGNKIAMTVLSILFPFGINLLIVVLSGYVASNANNPETTFQASSYNFLPYSLYWILCGIWLTFIVIGRFFTQKYLFIYRTHFHTQVVYFTWLYIEFNLLCLTILYPTLTLLGVIIFYLLSIGCAYAIIRTRLLTLAKLLNQTVGHKKDDWVGKTFNLILKYGWIVIVIWLIARFLFPGLGEIRTDWIGILGAILMWYALNIGYILLESYLYLPYFLQAYYKLKYPEEYRLREGKTLEEWYGEKYLKKYGGHFKNGKI